MVATNEFTPDRNFRNGNPYINHGYQAVSIISQFSIQSFHLYFITALNVPNQLQEIDFFKRDHLAENFVKDNPQHTIPLLDDNGFKIWDSHAINAYLVDTYGKDDSLYPKDRKQRAIVDQRLHFDSGILFPNVINITGPITKEGNLEPVAEWKRKTVEEGYQFVEKFLEKDGTKYIAGDRITIADFSIVTTITSTQMLVPTLTEAKYPLTVKI